ncbi:MAG: VapC toxin family PIN domain ribonuclease [Roseateles depolymerans]|uniref:Ribonuclease VapC n=1 Tax=Roseateles depolymerans TaxID=76731 RepID=A0A2W5DHD2_9BURK|nr:MAG: VapC toxin family PIN domain ribonuclease [Roseateles depolymerans]
MIAIDSSVLIDLLGGDARAEAAEDCLRQALSRGPVVACDVVLSEVVSGLGFGAELLDALEEVGIVYSPIESRAAVRAGEMQRRYKERRAGAASAALGSRAVPDFLIGAHALLQCQGLITRDDSFFRDYFKGLKLIVPGASSA